MSGAGPAPPPGFCMADRATELDDIEPSLRDLIIECEVTGRRTLFARGGQAIAGWGLGALISMGTLVAYGVLAGVVDLPRDAALLSLATFLFLTEVIEPPLLTR